MSSVSSPIREAIAGYLAGRIRAERLVAVVTEAYYGRDAGSGMRDAWRPMIEIIERAHPGVIELVASGDRPGFGIRLAERPFPRKYEAALREAAAAALSGSGMRDAGGVLRAETTHPASRIAHPGLLARVVAAVRRLFSASA